MTPKKLAALAAAVVVVVVAVTFAVVSFVSGGNSSDKVAAANGVATSTSAPKQAVRPTTQVSTTTPSPSTSVASTAHTTSSAVVSPSRVTPVGDFPPIEGLNFPISSATWRVTGGVGPEGYITVVTKHGDSVCHASTLPQNCPGFAVVNAAQSPFVRTDTKITDTCWHTGVVDNLYYGPATAATPVTIDGKSVMHNTRTRCSVDGSPHGSREVLHEWVFSLADGSKVVVFDLNTTSNDPLPGLPELLGQVTFK